MKASLLVGTNRSNDASVANIAFIDQPDACQGDLFRLYHLRSDRPQSFLHRTFSDDQIIDRIKCISLTSSAVPPEFLRDIKLLDGLIEGMYKRFDLGKFWASVIL